MLGGVQRFVGVLDQRVLVGPVLRIGRDAGRQRRQLLRPLIVDHGLAEAVSSLVAGFLVAADDDGELVAAEPEHLLTGARSRLEHAGDGDEGMVAGRVAAFTVVDLPELVQVDEHERDRRLSRRRLLEDRLEMLVERAAVAEERQRVAARFGLAQRKLASAGEVTRGDVCKGTDEVAVELELDVRRHHDQQHAEALAVGEQRHGGGGATRDAVRAVELDQLAAGCRHRACVAERPADDARRSTRPRVRRLVGTGAAEACRRELRLDGEVDACE